jgi:hypothetical protein
MKKKKAIKKGKWRQKQDRETKRKIEKKVGKYRKHTREKEG